MSAHLRKLIRSWFSNIFGGALKGTCKEVDWLLGFERVKKNLTQGPPDLSSVELFDLAIFSMTWRVTSSISLGISLLPVRLNISVKDFIIRIYTTFFRT